MKRTCLKKCTISKVQNIYRSLLVKNQIKEQLPNMTYIQHVKGFVWVRYFFLLTILLSLLGNQEVFGQCTLVKGQVVDYITGDPIISKIQYLNNGVRKNTGSLCDGNFELKIELENDSGYIFIESGFKYKVKIYNIPRDVEQFDLGKIKMVYNHRLGIMPNSHSKAIDPIEQDNKLRKEVLKKYRLQVNGKKLKPYFEGKDRENQFIVFDFKKEDHSPK